MLIKETVRAGHGQIKADMVITNAQLINVASSEIYPAEVAIKRGHVVAIGDVGHCKGLDRVIHDAKGHYFGPDDHRATHHWPECIGIWETVREFIQGEDDKVFEALEIAAQNKLQVFGCAPMCRGHKLAGYASAGIRLDHESYKVEEALEKLRKGMFMVVRESSISHFLQGNIQVVTKYAPMAAHQFAADPLPPSRACRHALPGNGQCMLACVRGWLDKEMIWG